MLASQNGMRLLGRNDEQSTLKQHIREAEVERRALDQVQQQHRFGEAQFRLKCHECVLHARALRHESARGGDMTGDLVGSIVVS